MCNVRKLSTTDGMAKKLTKCYVTCVTEMAPTWFVPMVMAHEELTKTIWNKREC